MATHEPSRLGEQNDYTMFQEKDGADGASINSKATTDLESGQMSPRSAKEPVMKADDWNGPDDPDNPWNWSLNKRVWHVIVPSLFSLCVTFGSSIYSPAIDQVAEIFDVSTTAAILPLSLWVLGLAFGPMISAPISETYGRLMVYRTTSLISMLFTLGAGFSNTFAALSACRFFAGLFGSSCLAVGSGTMADLFAAERRGPALIAYMTAPFLGPALGPVVGGFIVQFKDWRWTQWCILFFTLPVYIASLTMSETYKKAILIKRAKKFGLTGAPSTPHKWAGIKAILVGTLIRPLNMLFLEPIVTAFSVYIAFVMAILFAFFESFPLVFGEVYNFEVYQSGLAFVGIGLGVLLGAATLLFLNRTIYRKKAQEASAHDNATSPEHRLYGAMCGSVGVTAGLFWFGWSSRPSVHWIVPIIGTILFGWGNLCIFVSSAKYLVDVYGPKAGASAIAANGLLRYIAGAGFPLFTIQMYRTLTIPWATSLLGFISVLMLPIPWVLFKWGPRIRKHSHYDTIKA